VLYHCAGEVHDHNQMHSVHVEGTQKLCIAARNRIGHWVQLSSVGVYGPHFGGVVTESNRLNPQGIYEITKAESDKIITASSQNGFFSYSILRPSIVFGPTMSNQSLFQMIDVINKGFFFYIGEKGASANYIHVDNVVEGLIRCGTLTSAKNQTYVLSDQRTIEEFVAIIANALGRPLPTLRLSRKLVQYIVKSCRWIPRFPLTEGRINALTSRVIYSNSKIEQELKYEHPVIMEDGLREMVQSWNERRRKIV
jgi:nucleoside-diphosphate-sugar epimerase